MGTVRFTEKLNKRPDGSNYTIEEVLLLKDGKFEGFLSHDNINNSSISIYTGTSFTGNEITDYVISIPSSTPWRRSIRVYADVKEVYVTYQTPGDQVDADDINDIQDAIVETEASLTTALTQKVDKIAGKSLSTEDYTTAEKNKLSGIAANANNYAHPATHPPSIIVQDSSNRFVTDAEKTTWNAKASTAVATTSTAGLMAGPDKAKLDGIAAGAQVNTVASVNSKTGSIVLSAADVGADALGTAGGVQQRLTQHQDDDVKHITASERASWNAKADANGKLQVNLNSDQHNGFKKFSLMSQFGGIATDGFVALANKMPDLSSYHSSISSVYPFAPPDQAVGSATIRKYGSSRVEGLFLNGDGMWHCYYDGKNFTGWKPVASEGGGGIKGPVTWGQLRGDA